MGPSLLVSTLLLIATPTPIATAASVPNPAGSSTPQRIVEGVDDVLMGIARERSFGRESAGPDTFALYGGPARASEGRFEDATGLVPDRQGWVGVDLTEQPVFWQIRTFNAATLGGHGEENLAFWCGQDATQASGWKTPPGYGNGWDAALVFESAPVADPSAARTVSLDFLFHHESEPGYDFFFVEFERAGVWTEVLRIDGTDAQAGGFVAPGVRFTDVATAPIAFLGHDYGVDDRIRLRLRFESDGAWSDQDGLFATTAGAVQIDDVVLDLGDGPMTEDFEGAAPHLFTPQKQPFAGDFSVVLPRVRDLDPCAEDRSPVMCFIDAGQAPVNGPGADGTVSTGGTTSTLYGYGSPAGWVVNHTGGLSGDLVPLANEVWSPPIAWDLPGPDDDGPDVVGALLRFSVWEHLPLGTGIYRTWSVRSRAANGTWTRWRDRSFVYYSPSTRWKQAAHVIGDLLAVDRTQVQIALGVRDLADLFGMPGGDATPAPLYDNVSLQKYRFPGPVMTTRVIDLAHDAFPAPGPYDVATSQGRDALDVRFDMTRDINTRGPGIDPGDSIVVDVAAMIPGTSVQEVSMHWALRRNPVFDDVRQVPSSAYDVDVDTSQPVWTGRVLGRPATTGSGSVVTGRWFFDLPDEDFLHPGDVLHYYLEATDDEGRAATLPGDLDAFGAFDSAGRSSFARTFTLRGLPTLHVDGSQPWALFVDESPPGSNLDEIEFGMGENGWIEGFDFDLYFVRGATSLVSNGIGAVAGHGADANQLFGYEQIWFLADEASVAHLSDGSDQGANDKSDDLAVLTAWKQLPGPRTTVYFGNHVAWTTADESAAGAGYVASIMGVEVVDASSGSALAEQAAPEVQPVSPLFATAFAAYRGCPEPADFAYLRPAVGAVAGHLYRATDGTTIVGPAASVVFDRVDPTLQRRLDITFPCAITRVFAAPAPQPHPTTGRTAIATLMREIEALAGRPTSGSPVGAPATERVLLDVAPNPFNPTTVIRFRGATGQPTRVDVFDLRGRRIASLFEGSATGATQEFRWDARDRASGVYLVQVTSGERHLTHKIALVR